MRDAPSHTTGGFSEAGAEPSERRDGRASAPQRKRRRILRAAAALFASQGFTKTRVDEISAKAGVSKGLVYVHFPSKEALLEQVMSDAILESGSEAARAASRPGLTTAERIKVVLRSWIEYAERHPILQTLLAQDPGRLLPEELNHTDRLAADYAAAMEGLLRHGIGRGELRADLDVAYAARAIWLVHSALNRELFVEHPASAKADAQRLADATIDLILHGCVA
jgi:AcrR family transcriptional regulator